MKIAGTVLSERGFTLIEVLIAGAIITIGMTAVVPLLLNTYQIDTRTSVRVRAQFGMAQKMDELLSAETPSCNNILVTDYIDAQTGQVSTAVPSVPVVITRTWIVGTSTNTGLYDNGHGGTEPHPLCPMTVTVSYPDPYKQQGTKTLSMVAQKGN